MRCPCSSLAKLLHTDKVLEGGEDSVGRNTWWVLAASPFYETVVGTYFRNLRNVFRTVEQAFLGKTQPKL